jgi:hypothetical protein
MTPKQNNTLSADERQATIQELLQDRMRLAIRHTLITYWKRRCKLLFKPHFTKGHLTERIVATDILKLRRITIPAKVIGP